MMRAPLAPGSRLSTVFRAQAIGEDQHGFQEPARSYLSAMLLAVTAVAGLAAVCVRNREYNSPQASAASMSLDEVCGRQGSSLRLEHHARSARR